MKNCFNFFGRYSTFAGLQISLQPIEQQYRHELTEQVAEIHRKLLLTHGCLDEDDLTGWYPKPFYSAVDACIVEGDTACPARGDPTLLMELLDLQSRSQGDPMWMPLLERIASMPNKDRIEVFIGRDAASHLSFIE